MRKGFGHEIIKDRDAFVHRVFLFPGRGLHLGKPGPYDDLDVPAAESERGPAAVHRRVAAAEHDDAVSDRSRMAERHARKPVDADMNVPRSFAPPWRVEVTAARGAAANEYRVEPFGHHGLEALDALRGDEHSPGRQRVANLLVDHFIGQAKLRNLTAHHAASLRVGIEDDHFVADCREIAGDRQRGRPRADAADALAVALGGGFRQAIPDVAFPVGGDAFEAADGDRLLLQAATPASGLARPVAGSSQNSWKDVRFPVDEIGAVMVAIRDAANVFGDRRMRRAGPLTVNHFVEVIGMRKVGRLHDAVISLPSSTGNG